MHENMKLREIIKNISILCMTVIMTATTVISVNAATKDVIDSSKTGSITIHKYDITAAEKAGVDVTDMISTGEKNAEAEHI